MSKAGINRSLILLTERKQNTGQRQFFFYFVSLLHKKLFSTLYLYAYQTLYIDFIIVCTNLLFYKEIFIYIQIQLSRRIRIRHFLSIFYCCFPILNAPISFAIRKWISEKFKKKKIFFKGHHYQTISSPFDIQIFFRFLLLLFSLFLVDKISILLFMEISYTECSSRGVLKTL